MNYHFLNRSVLIAFEKTFWENILSEKFEK